MLDSLVSFLSDELEQVFLETELNDFEQYILFLQMLKRRWSVQIMNRLILH